MSDKSSEKMKKTDSDDQKECYASQGDTTGQQPRGRKQRWKIAVFALGVFLVIGVTTHSLITRHSNVSSVPTDNSGVQPIDISSVPQITSNTDSNASIVPFSTSGARQLSITGVRAIASNTGSGALVEMGIGDLVWAKELIATFTNHDFVLVILQENNSNNALANRISDATEKIEARGARVGTLTLSASNPELSTTMRRLTIGQLPAVLAISNIGRVAIITGDITEETLLQTYVVISQPICAPGSSPGCCGGK